MTKQISKNRPFSLSLRVTAIVGIATTLCLIVVGLIVQRSIASHFAEQDSEELQVVGNAVRDTLTNFDSNKVDIAEVLETAVSGHHGVYFMVTSSDNKVLYSMPGPDLSLLMNTPTVEEIDSGTFFDWEENGQSFRGALLSIDTPPVTAEVDQPPQFNVAVAAATDFHLNFMVSFNSRLWIIMTAASLITIFAAWFAVHQAHAPLRYVSNRIRSVGPNQLPLRLEADLVPVELAKLASSFNDMIERVENVFHRLSNFSADIAHELRTPIMNITTQTQVILSKTRETDEYREILYSNLEEFEGMAKMVNDLLMLAKSDNGLLKPMVAELDLVTEMEELFDYFGALTEEKNISLSLVGRCQLIWGDRSMLRRALSNLISNAIHHTPSNGKIVVSLKSAGNNALIQVSNPGLNIPQEHLAKLFDRFYRADPARQGNGAGLGLAIVKSIIDIHNGTITAKSSNGISVFTVSLPSTGLT